MRIIFVISALLANLTKHDIIVDITEVVMGQILVRNVNDQALELLRARAIGNGTSLEAEVRHLIEREGKPTKAEILKVMQRIRARSKEFVPSLTLDEIREGLE